MGLVATVIVTLASLPLTSGGGFKWPKHAAKVMFPKTFQAPTDGAGSKFVPGSALNPSTPTASTVPNCEKPDSDFFYHNSRLSGGTYYYHDKYQRERGEARDHCQEFGAHLVKIRNQVEYESVLQFNEKRNVNLWLGLKVKEGTDIPSNGCDMVEGNCPEGAVVRDNNETDVDAFPIGLDIGYLPAGVPFSLNNTQAHVDAAAAAEAAADAAWLANKVARAKAVAEEAAANLTASGQPTSLEDIFDEAAYEAANVIVREPVSFDCIYMKGDADLEDAFFERGSIDDHDGGCDGDIDGPHVTDSNVKAICQYDCQEYEECNFLTKVIDAREWPNGDFNADRYVDPVPLRLLTDGCDSYDKPSSDLSKRWACPVGGKGTSDGDKGCFVTLDLGCMKHIGGVTVRNAANAAIKDTSTKDFSIYASMDNQQWEYVASSSLTDVRELSCAETPLVKFPFPSVKGRYVRFVVDSYFGAAGGLKYIQVDSVDHCPPERMKFNILEGVHHCDPVDPTQCFPPENILKQRPYCDNDNPNQGEGLWIGPENNSSAYFILDTGCEFPASRLEIRNGRNGDTMNCGVDIFQLWATEDRERYPWRKVAGGKLESTHSKACKDQQNKVFNFPPTQARYFWFQVLSIQDDLPHACLQYFDVY